jgi:comEA protein
MKKFIKKTGLTSKELGVISFLLVTFCAGLLVKYSGWKKPNEYDYSETDKNFESRLKSTFEELKSAPEDSIAKLRATELNALADSLGLEIENNTKEKKTLKPGVKVNINTALAADLLELPGIGQVMAERIIEYRETNGKFRNTEELKKVKGIGERKFDDIKEHLTIE